LNKRRLTSLLVTAGTVIVVGPLLVLFLVFQRQFIDSFLHSGLK